VSLPRPVAQLPYNVCAPYEELNAVPEPDDADPAAGAPLVGTPRGALEMWWRDGSASWYPGQHLG